MKSTAAANHHVDVAHDAELFGGRRGDGLVDDRAEGQVGLNTECVHGSSPWLRWFKVSGRGATGLDAEACKITRGPAGASL